MEDAIPAMPATAAALHQLFEPFAPLIPYIDQLRKPIKPYTTKFDDLFEATFGPMHALTRSLPLNKPHIALVSILVYLTIVTTVLPLFRALGLAVKVKPLMRLYNFFMVTLSGYMFLRCVQLAIRDNDSVFCVPQHTGVKGEEMAQLVWIFTYSKIVEFLDTMFMLIEGRYRQISFLHVYHHATILSYWFVILWQSPGSDAYFSLAGNSFIHVLMYGYYLLASFGYSPWWKFYITKAQIAQFCLFCVQSVYVGYATGGKCDFPLGLSRGLLWYMLTLILLFTHFLLTNKGSKKKKTKEQ